MNRYAFLFSVSAWCALVGVSLWTRPLIPLDETRYVTVAFEMWQQGVWLVPVLNGETYSHKPPLLFWLIQLSWLLFGVNEITARLIAPFFALGNVVLTAYLAQLLWAGNRSIATLTPIVLLSTSLWMIFTTLTMFDMLVTFFTLLAIIGMVKVWQTQQARYWWLTGIAVGGGILAKGPVILLFILPLGFTAIWWSVNTLGVHYGVWLRGFIGSVAGGVIIALSWALPAAWYGGDEYAHAIFWGQTAHRVVESFAHQRPIWWYLTQLPLLFFPWLFWLPAWRAGLHIRAVGQDAGIRLCLVWFFIPFSLLSLISGKQVHYLLPIFPAFALLLTALLCQFPAPARMRDQSLPALIIIIFSIFLLLIHYLPLEFAIPKWFYQIQPIVGILLLSIALFSIAPLAQRHTQIVRLSLLSLMTFLIIHLGFTKAAAPFYDLKPLSELLKIAQAKQIPIAQLCEYHGQYHFLGRLNQPIAVIDKESVKTWITQHSDNIVIQFTRSRPQTHAIVFIQPYRDGYLIAWRGQDFLSYVDTQAIECYDN